MESLNPKPTTKWSLTSYFSISKNITLMFAHSWIIENFTGLYPAYFPKNRSAAGASQEVYHPWKWPLCSNYIEPNDEYEFYFEIFLNGIGNVVNNKKSIAAGIVVNKKPPNCAKFCQFRVSIMNGNEKMYTQGINFDLTKNNSYQIQKFIDHKRLFKTLKNNQDKNDPYFYLGNKLKLKIEVILVQNSFFKFLSKFFIFNVKEAKNSKKSKSDGNSKVTYLEHTIKIKNYDSLLKDSSVSFIESRYSPKIEQKFRFRIYPRGKLSDESLLTVTNFNDCNNFSSTVNTQISILDNENKPCHHSNDCTDVICPNSGRSTRYDVESLINENKEKFLKNGHLTLKLTLNYMVYQIKNNEDVVEPSLESYKVKSLIYGTNHISQRKEKVFKITNFKQLINDSKIVKQEIPVQLCENQNIIFKSELSKNSRNQLSLMLKFESENIGAVSAQYRVTILDEENNRLFPKIKEDLFKRGQQSGFINLIAIDKLNSSIGLIKDDTLTLVIEIWPLKYSEISKTDVNDSKNETSDSDMDKQGVVFKNCNVINANINTGKQKTEDQKFEYNGADKPIPKQS